MDDFQEKSSACLVCFWAAFDNAEDLLDYLEQYHGEIGFYKEVDHDQSI